MDKGFWEFFVKNHRLTKIIVIFIAIFGLLSAAFMVKEAEPEVDIPVMVVATPFPGASAVDVEELVTNPLEESLQSLDEIDEITSSSSTGISSITVTFDVNADLASRLQDVKDKVDEVKIDLPDEAEDPIIQRIRLSDTPILVLSVSGHYDIEQLSKFAKTLKEDIQGVAGVSQVQITGDRESEIRVIVNKAVLDQFGIGISQVTQAIAQANSDIPVGSIQSDTSEYTIQFSGRLENAKDVANIAIAQKEGVPILVNDVAQIVDGLEETNSISQLSLQGESAVPSVSLSILKVGGADALKLIEDVYAQIEQSKGETVPEDVVIYTLTDNADSIRDSLSSLSINGMETVLIVILLLLFFLGWREALLAGLAIPLSFLMAFMIIFGLGYTLNNLILFGLILSLGILVDGAIVVTEAINKNIVQGGDSKQAVIDTIREFQKPLVAGTLTTVFAFLPMLLTSGIIGKYIESIPISVSIVLTSSLFVALALITTLSVNWLKPKTQDDRDTRWNRLKKKRDTFVDDFLERYRATITALIDSKKKQKKFLITLVLLLVASFALPVTGILRVNMFPSVDEDSIFLDIEEPIGTNLSVTEETMSIVENYLYQDDRIESFLINIGAPSTQGTIVGGESRNPHLGGALITLVDESKRKEKSYDIVDQMEVDLNTLVDAQISISQLGVGPESSDPVEIRLFGKDLSLLENTARDISDQLRLIEGTKNVRISQKDTVGEFALHIDRVKARLYGVSTIQVASTLRNAVSGSKATVIRNNGDDTDVIVKYALNSSRLNADYDTAKATLSDIESLTINTPTGEVPLSSFVRTDLQNSTSAIRHKDTVRFMSVTSGLIGDKTAAEVFTEIQDIIENQLQVDEGIDVTYGGENEDVAESFSDMVRSLIMGLFLIAALLVWQFNSYRQPLFIIITIPLAFIGVFPGLTMLGLNLTFPGVIGVVALAGIVVNNAIILIDRMNESRRSGMDRRQAVIESGIARFTPILLTTITTVAGLLPLALQDEVWGPVAYSIIFGLLFSTVLTLFVVPVLYFRYAEDDIDS